MTNPDLVAVPLRDGTELRLVAGVNALCECEAELARAGFNPTQEMKFLNAGISGTVSAVRALVWAFAKDQHPGLTLRHVGDLLGTDGEALRKGLAEALNRGSAEKEDGEPSSGKTTPPAD
ncbi:hypothetical protein C4N9_20480 [Pararhodobacter marinus]|uniref:Gene transfer agent family protein n=1 Tax=Pararhodobacter marinus TaxID=2184063 RepID=A0A2U2C431_9RHOB|nr:hypothetical protein [Pararhodobacter marinus]PWE26645.1 hypothetical protein C4N9_20480 [Pararhodobacter marinus]